MEEQATGTIPLVSPLKKETHFLSPESGGVKLNRVSTSGGFHTPPDSTSFDEINPIEIANMATGKSLPEGVNLCLYALVKRCECSADPHTFKDELIDYYNEIAKQEGYREIPDGAEWDDIFRILEKYNLVVTAERAIRLDTRGIQKIKDYYGEIVFPKDKNN